MTPDQLVGLTGNLIPLVTKLFLLLIVFLYGIFAAILVRQVQLMNRVVTEVGFSPILLTVAVIHLLAVVLVFFLTVILI